MQIGKLALQEHVIVICARYVPGPTGAGTAPVYRLMHRRQYLWVLAHAEIVIGTPDDHLLGAVLPVMRRTREATRLTLDVGEDAVASFAAKITELLKEEGLVIHHVSPWIW